MRFKGRTAGATALALILLASICSAQGSSRITILYDAFGNSPGLVKDWGYSALVEYAGKRVLFDTGNDEAKFERNVKALGVDLKRLDFVVLSHRHGDHTAGLHYLLRVNPRVRIYAPSDEHFGGRTSSAFYRRSEDSLPRHMRYFDGDPPEIVPRGSAWRRVRFIQVESPLEVVPGMRIIPAISSAHGTMELRELSLGIDTPTGQILLVGCSHPGIEKIVESAAKINPRLSLIAGGLHLVTTPTSEIERIATALRERWKVERIAPGHCTGEPAFAALQRTFGDRYIYAGLGTVIELSRPGTGTP